MRLPKKGEKGFTLIELLIVVAILGVLAAVVIPNVSRFFGRGQTEARKTEKHNVQLAIGMMMADNNLSSIPHAVADTTAVKDMAAFPDSTSDWNVSPGGKKYDPNGILYATGDKAGYLLYGHDLTATSHDQTALVNYMPKQLVNYWYTVTSDGTVTQYGSADKSVTYTDQ